MTSERKPDPERVEHYVELFRAGAELPPVLVDLHRAIIDGLNRVEAARKLGHQTIEGTVALAYEEATECLKVNHLYAGLVPPVRRIQDMYEDLQPLAHRYTSDMRGAGLPTARALLAAAIGMKESTLSCITAYYSNLHGSHQERAARAREIKDVFESGERSPSWALTFIARGSIRLDGGITDARQQREIFTTVVGSIRGALRGLGGLQGVSPKIKKEELDGWIAELRASRRDLAKYVQLLEECRNSD
jgi:hypothetical protein